MGEFCVDSELAEVHSSMMQQVNKLLANAQRLCTTLWDMGDRGINESTLRGYIEDLFRVQSELNSFLVLEDTVRVTFSYLRDMPAREFFSVQKNINEVINEEYVRTVGLLTVDRKLPVTDSGVINLIKDIREMASDLLDMIEGRKDKLNEFMSEIGEQFE